MPHLTIRDHDGVLRPGSMTRLAHRLDPACWGVISSPTASKPSAELADRGGLLLGCCNKLSHLQTRHGRGNDDADSDRTELLLQIIDLVARVKGDELFVQPQEQRVPPRTHHAQPIR